MKKKLLSIILAGVMTMGLLAGCGSSSDSDKTSDSSKSETSDTSGSSSSDNAQADDSKTSNSGGNILVVYYSATGSTKAVAEKIAEETNGELFELKPVKEYTDDDLNWSNDDSRVSKEHDDESLRDVELTEVTPDDFKDVKTVILGYPIWWGIAAWPVDNFVKDNDFTGKTIIPFCTSASSGIGDSGKLLEKMAGTGNWQDGERFRSGASDSDITSWVDSLGL